MPTPRFDTIHLVREFHETFGAPVNNGPATLDLPKDVIDLRLALIMEEVAELFDAVYGARAGEVIRNAFEDAQNFDDGERDIIGAADALGDIDYVLSGTALTLGIPHADVVAEIHASNMSKAGADGQPILREDGKILKGPNYFRPNIAAVLGLTGQ